MDGQVHGRIGQRIVGDSAVGESVFWLSGAALPPAESFENDLAAAPPERLSISSLQVDHRANIYGLGLVLYQLLCGCIPFRSQDATELRRQVIDDEPQPPRQLAHGIPAQVESICLRALSKAPSARFQSAAEMAAALCSVLAQEVPGSSSSVHLSGLQIHNVSSAQVVFLIVDFRITGSNTSERTSGGPSSIDSQLNRLAEECLAEISAERMKWSAAGLLFRAAADSPDEAGKMAVGTGLRIASQIV